MKYTAPYSLSGFGHVTIEGVYSSHLGTRIHLYKNGKEYETSVRFNNFTDGDSHCLIEDISHIKDADALIYHQLYPNQNEWIVRLLLLLNTLQSLKVRSIKVFTPYFPYARQDKAHLPGEAISNRILCQLLRTSGCSELYTIDCHFMKGKPKSTLAGLKIHNILVQDLLLNALADTAGDKLEIIGPDAGSSYLANGKTMHKSRAAHYHEQPEGPLKRDIASMEDSHLKIDVQQKGLVIADDMIATGSTIIEALGLLKRRAIKPIYVLTTHGFFLNDSYDKIKKLADGIIYSDTIPKEGSIPVVQQVFEQIKTKVSRV